MIILRFTCEIKCLNEQQQIVDNRANTMVEKECNTMYL